MDLKLVLLRHFNFVSAELIALIKSDPKQPRKRGAKPKLIELSCYSRFTWTDYLDKRLHFFPFGANLDIHRHYATEKYAGLNKSAEADWFHSKTGVNQGGGEIIAKVIRRVDSFEREVAMPDGSYTTLRDIIYKKRDPATGKPLIIAMRPIPTAGIKTV